MTNPSSDAQVAAYINKLQRRHGMWMGSLTIFPDAPIERVGIIGAGTMGGGISMNFASAGIPVTIVETKQEALDRGLGVIQKNYQRSADRGRFPQEEVAIAWGNTRQHWTFQRWLIAI